MKPNAQTQRLIEQRDQLVIEMEALRNKIAGLDIAIALLTDQLPLAAGESGPRKVKVTVTLLDLLRESGSKGLNAQALVDMAAERGLPLNRGSVSSLLSRLKKDGTLVYDSTRYKLKEFSRELARVGTEQIARAA